MENASKALIIAGSILIAILLISVGIMIVKSGQGTVETGKTGLKAQEIQMFNSRFEIYKGERTGSEIRKLISLSIANNATGEHKVAVRGYNIPNTESIVDNKTYTVTFNYSDGEPLDSFPNPNPGRQGGSYSNLNNCYRNEVTTEKGYINYIYIE